MKLKIPQTLMFRSSKMMRKFSFEHEVAKVSPDFCFRSGSRISSIGSVALRFPNMPPANCRCVGHCRCREIHWRALERWASRNQWRLNEYRWRQEPYSDDEDFMDGGGPLGCSCIERCSCKKHPGERRRKLPRR